MIVALPGYFILMFLLHYVSDLKNRLPKASDSIAFSATLNNLKLLGPNSYQLNAK